MDTRVDIRGIDELRKALRKVSPQLSKTLQKAHKKIATEVVAKVKPAVSGLSSPGGSRAVGGIRPRATQKSAEIAFLGSARNKPLMATILGSDVHPVYGRYYAADSMKRRLWKPHLGNSWQPQQLYGVGPVLEKAQKTFIYDEYVDAVLDAIQESFPGD